MTRDYAEAYAQHEGLDGCVLHDVATLVPAWRRISTRSSSPARATAERPPGAYLDLIEAAARSIFQVSRVVPSCRSNRVTASR
jgi:hypothetical protein